MIVEREFFEPKEAEIEKFEKAYKANDLFKKIVESIDRLPYESFRESLKSLAKKFFDSTVDNYANACRELLRVKIKPEIYEGVEDIVRADQRRKRIHDEGINFLKLAWERQKEFLHSSPLEQFFKHGVDRDQISDFMLSLSEYKRYQEILKERG